MAPKAKEGDGEGVESTRQEIGHLFMIVSRNQFNQSKIIRKLYIIFFSNSWESMFLYLCHKARSGKVIGFRSQPRTKDRLYIRQADKAHCKVGRNETMEYFLIVPLYCVLQSIEYT